MFMETEPLETTNEGSGVGPVANQHLFCQNPISELLLQVPVPLLCIHLPANTHPGGQQAMEVLPASHVKAQWGSGSWCQHGTALKAAEI